jgi:hypothetical protein
VTKESKKRRRFRSRKSLGTLGSVPGLQERFEKFQGMIIEADDVGEDKMPPHLAESYGDPDAVSWDAVRVVNIEFGRHGYAMNRGQKDQLHKFMRSFVINMTPQAAK